MAYDAAGQQVVLFGGAGPNNTPLYDDTWVWDGTNWTEKFPATSPPARSLSAMTYDEARSQIVLFAGFTGTCCVSPCASDTWVWGTPFAAQIQPPVNADGSSIFNAKRGVVPVKFTLAVDGSPTCDLPSATISLTRTAGTVVGSIDESVYLSASDSGSNFRIDTINCQYVYNLGTSSLGTGTYSVKISIGGSVVGTGIFGLQ